MDDTLNSVLVKIEEWGVQIEWNLTHVKLNAVCYRTSESQTKRLYGWYNNMGGMIIAKSEALDVLGTSKRSDLE